MINNFRNAIEGVNFETENELKLAIENAVSEEVFDTTYDTCEIDEWFGSINCETELLGTMHAYFDSKDCSLIIYRHENEEGEICYSYSLTY